ncbi:glycosyltransferase [Actinoalloteichus fjordicus]|uniref:glycosyltransferase n=1 Tax=Actinoalloteichus fjordicus TaxID=1612552 RepID=UPI0009529CFA|nr:glycosyltransferase family 4 protein [Actinoalloteichus fjordicus]
MPLESYAAGAAPVIATTAGGLAEQVVDGRTGFSAAPNNPVSLAAAIRRGLALTPAGRDRMRDRGRQFAAAHHDHPQAVRIFLGQVAPWLTTSVSQST